MCKTFGRLEKFTFVAATFPWSDLPCVFEGIMPGEYRVKAVWYQTKRLEPSYNCVKCLPKTGDYESLMSPVFEVKAGEKT